MEFFGIEFVDIVVLVMWLCMVKFVEEIVYIIEMVCIVDIGGVVCVEVVVVGVLEYEVVLYFIVIMVCEIVKFWFEGELMDIWIWF